MSNSSADRNHCRQIIRRKFLSLPHHQRTPRNQADNQCSCPVKPFFLRVCRQRTKKKKKKKKVKVTIIICSKYICLLQFFYSAWKIRCVVQRCKKDLQMCHVHISRSAFCTVEQVLLLNTQGQPWSSQHVFYVLIIPWSSESRQFWSGLYLLVALGRMENQNRGAGHGEGRTTEEVDRNQAQSKPKGRQTYTARPMMALRKVVMTSPWFIS